jgi:hypothetical protein
MTYNKFEKLFCIGDGIILIKFLKFTEFLKISQLSTITHNSIVKIYENSSNYEYNIKNQYYGGNIIYYKGFFDSYLSFIFKNNIFQLSYIIEWS